MSRVPPELVIEISCTFLATWGPLSETHVCAKVVCVTTMHKAAVKIDRCFMIISKLKCEAFVDYPPID
jgi:hypothetical protein